MWHEARRVEKQLRGMMVNFKRRAERRRAFYSRMKQDPVQLLRVYGHKCKIHIDAQVAAAAEHSSVMMPWQGHADNMIDRFDGRAHLDIIPENPQEEVAGPLMETDPEQNRLNYERYRTLVMIDHSGASEEEYLQQLEVEEMFPKKDESKDKKDKSVTKASIGYTYDDSPATSGIAEGDDDSEGSDDSDSESIPSDIDVTVDVDELTKLEIQELDSCAMNYGMAPAQYCRKLKVDKVEAEEQKKIREEEEERALMGGRRSRKDRRSIRDKQRYQRVQNSPPSYARRSSPTYEPYRSRSSSRSSSRSCSPENAGQVEFITEFGASDVITSNKPERSGDSRTHSSLSRNKDRSKSRESEHEKRRRRSRDRERSRRSRSRDRRRSYDRSRSRSRERRRSRSRSSSRDRDRSRDRSRSRDRRGRRSRSRSRSRTRIYREDREGRERDRYRDQGRESRESQRAKDTAKASAKLLGMSKVKQATDSKDKTKLTPQERMKKRMQLMLNKQLKVDRKEERIKRDVKEQERLDREDDLRQMQRKWREKNHRSPSPRSWSSYRRSRSRSPERSRRHSDSDQSPTRPVPVVDFEEQTRGEEVIHYVYEND